MQFFNDLLEAIKAQYTTYGYLIVFLAAYLENTVILGLILPGGSLVLLGAIYAAGGTLSLPLVIFFGWIGMALGNSTDYWIGRFGLYRLIENTRLKKYLDPHMASATDFLNKRGGAAIFISHFIGHLRSFVAMTAGAVKFPFRRFAVYELAAALIWNLIYALAGFFLAASASTFESIFGGVSIVMVGLLAIGYGGYKFMERQKKEVHEDVILPAEPEAETTASLLSEKETGPAHEAK